MVEESRSRGAQLDSSEGIGYKVYSAASSLVSAVGSLFDLLAWANNELLNSSDLEFEYLDLKEVKESSEWRRYRTSTHIFASVEFYSDYLEVTPVDSVIDIDIYVRGGEAAEVAVAFDRCIYEYPPRTIGSILFLQLNKNILGEILNLLPRNSGADIYMEVYERVKHLLSRANLESHDPGSQYINAVLYFGSYPRVKMLHSASMFNSYVDGEMETGISIDLKVGGNYPSFTIWNERSGAVDLLMEYILLRSGARELEAIEHVSRRVNDAASRAYMVAKVYRSVIRELK